MIKSIQRAIISGFLVETFVKEDVLKRIEICQNLIPRYKDYFTREQLQILRAVFYYAKKFLEKGKYHFGLSEYVEKVIEYKYPHLKEELIECLATGPLTEELIIAYLDELEKLNLDL